MPNFAHWLDKMKKSWETKDYELLATMFPEKLTYFESPFLPPLTDAQQVVEQWKKDVEKQQNIQFGYKILHENEEACFTHWSASFDRENTRVFLDGIFYFKLIDNQCIYFRQWWVTK